MMEIFRRILVPYDFSDAATSALQVAADLAARHRGSLTVVHAIAPVYPVSSFAGAGEMPVWVPPDDLRADARKRLEAEVARVVGKRVANVTCHVVVGDPHHCILRAARGADSIVMATLGRTGLAHLVIGSDLERRGRGIGEVVRYEYPSEDIHHRPSWPGVASVRASASRKWCAKNASMRRHESSAAAALYSTCIIGRASRASQGWPASLMYE